MKVRFFFGLLFAALFLWVSATAIMAQEEPPPPYNGLDNPFPWDDASVKEAGKGLYRLYCMGCHGADGSKYASADFSAADFPQQLEEEPDFYFWTLSEGRFDRGMPPFKSSLTEEQRWQVLTYLRSISQINSPANDSSSQADTGKKGESLPVAEEKEETPAVAEGEEALELIAPEQAPSGQPLTLTAVLRDSQDRPIADAPVKFLIKVDFFTSGLIEIGEAVTDEDGVGVLEYTPRQTSDIEFVARYKDIETLTTVSLAESTAIFYQTETGLHNDNEVSWPEVFIGPQSAVEPAESGDAPTTGLRIPGGLQSLLLLAYVFALILVWSFYMRVMYQVLRISSGRETRGINVRLLPMTGLAVMLVLVTLLVLILITGPYSHFNLLH